jgi:hypothetical protein
MTGIGMFKVPALRAARGGSARPGVTCKAASNPNASNNDRNPVHHENLRHESSHSHHALPELEDWDEGEGLFPVRHPGAFPTTGKALHRDSHVCTNPRFWLLAYLVVLC